MSTVAPQKPPPPRPSAPGKPNIGSAPTRSFSISRGTAVGAQRIGIYGTGGVGKTKLAALLKSVGVRPLIIDIENGSKFLDVERVGDLQTWEETRDVLHNTELLAPFDAIVIDSFTKAEEYADAFTLRTVPNESGRFVDKIESYGYGKGFSYAYETFLAILSDLDAIIRSGKHVIVICHDCKASVPNPYGEDWIRYEPRLRETPKGPTRSRVIEWCDHFLYIGYDVNVTEEGKGQGSGTRTIYPVEMPTHKAKSRSISEPIVYVDGGVELWEMLFKKGE